jgi:hypothetical protein
MGDPSSLRLVPDSSASIPIDWSRIPEASKKFLLGSQQRSLPATIGELAKMIDGRRFFGYMGPELCTLLMDISELGLKDQQASGVLPRFYMKYLQAVWFILFLPGKRNGISGYSPDIDADEVSDDEDVFDGKEVSHDEKVSHDGEVSDDEEEYCRRMYAKEQQRIANETELAKQFDRKLTREISRGATDIVDITEKLCGWAASMLEGSLENAQFMTAMLTLPPSHPGRRAMTRDIMSSISRR